jgi:nucleoside-diphosphate-sugar epimerase
VLYGHERDKVITAAAGCDVIVVTAAPDARKSATVEEREENYRRILVETCRNAAAASDRVIFASSFSVYGDGGSGDDPISETSPTSNHDEPSSKYYQLAEDATLTASHGCVLRFPDMYGAPGDMSYPDRVRMCHEYMGGKAIFSATAPLYCIHYLDVVRSIEHVISEDLSGTYNVCDNERAPYTNQQVFDAICDEDGLPRLEFLGHIKMPERRISADKLYATGYQTEYDDPNTRVVERQTADL